MAGMLQILTYLIAVHLVVKGIEVLQIGLASQRSDRLGLVIFGGLVLIGCVYCSFNLVTLQDSQATAITKSMQSGLRE